MISNTVSTKIRTTLFTVLFVLLITTTSFAANYYVDNNNASASDSNSGISETSPWRTIQKAANVAKAGDTVYVKNGVYNERVLVQNSGLKNEPITFQAYPGHKPVIDGTGINITGYTGLFQSANKDYITVDGFEIRYSKALLFAFKGGTGGILKNSILHSNFSSGLNGVYFTTSTNCFIDNNEVYNTGWNAISITSSTNVKTRYNYIHDNPAHVGVNIFPNTGEVQKIYTGNDVINNVIVRAKVGIYMRWQADNKIIGNLVYDSGDPNITYWDGNGDGIELAAHPSKGESSYIANTKIYNNTIVGNNRNGLINKSAKNIIMKNNIFSHNKAAQVNIATITGTNHELNYNNYYHTGTLKITYNGKTYNSISTYKNDSGQDANGLNIAPPYKDLSRNDYTLTQGPNAFIDGGENLPADDITVDINGTPRPTGGGIDIGSFEYPDGSTSIPLPPENLRII